MNDQATINVHQLVADLDALRIERDALIAENEAMKATDSVVRENETMRRQLLELGRRPPETALRETRPALVAAALETLVASTVVLTICRTREFKSQDGRGYGGDSQPTEQLERLEKSIEQLREALK